MYSYQAVECYLANVQPMYPEDGKWDHKSIGRFEELTHGNCINKKTACHSVESLKLKYLFILTQLHSGKN